MSKKDKGLIAVMLVIIVLIMIIPLLTLKNAEFGGSDDSGSQVVEEINGEEYVTWFTPIIETIIDGELSGETECLLFCIQTGIGVGIIAYNMGRFVERKKLEEKEK